MNDYFSVRPNASVSLNLHSFTANNTHVQSAITIYTFPCFIQVKPKTTIPPFHDNLKQRFSYTQDLSTIQRPLYTLPSFITASLPLQSLLSQNSKLKAQVSKKTIPLSTITNHTPNTQLPPTMSFFANPTLTQVIILVVSFVAIFIVLAIVFGMWWRRYTVKGRKEAAGDFWGP